ncbi:cell division protein PerM [Jatrophihabitans sp. YIM 134969]
MASPDDVDAPVGDDWSDVTRSPGGWRAWSDVTRSDDRWSDDPVGWAMPMVCARHLRRAAAWMGMVAALGGALASLVLVVALWLLQASATGSPGAAMRAGVLLFLGSHHGGVTIAGDTVRFLPLGLMALAMVLPWRAGRALAALADDRGQRSGLRPAFVRLVLAYVGCVAVLGLFGRVGTSHAEYLPTVGASLLLVVVAAGLGARRELARRDDAALLPEHLLPVARAAAAAALVSAAMSSLLVAAAIAWHGGRVMDLSHALGGGLSGIPVLFVGVLSAPNAVVAVGSLLSGPGFAVGTDTVVTVGGSHSGLLPSVPLLGALPDGGGVHPVVVVWAALTFVGIGLAVARVLGRSRSPLDALRRHLGVAVVAAVAMAGLALLAGGGLGSGRLRAVGASPWQAGLAFGGEVLVAGLLVTCVTAIGRLVRVDDVPALEVRPASVVDTVLVVPVEAAPTDAADVPVAADPAPEVDVDLGDDGDDERDEDDDLARGA